MSANYVVGIDLGTTNNVLSYVALNFEDAEVQLLEIPQLTAPATIESQTSLPSFTYLGTPGEAEQGSLDVAWETGRDYAVGQWARTRSAEAPDRTVGGAKSWLSHHKVDRQQAILPFNVGDDLPKISPVEASRRYLNHLVEAWNQAFPDSPLIDQKVVLTVPASFDASARELTREAALSAGLPENLTLLEEPQAAVYAWLSHQGDNWRKALKLNDKLLVCDVGGGTTDMSLISVAEENGELILERMAVGNHLLVGGDNMDLAIAFEVSNLFKEKGTNLDPWQSVSLWHSCRAAKESLLAEDGPDEHSISVLGRGSKLIGGTVTVQVQRERIRNLLLEGFFPECQATDHPQRNMASGFQELGLPYEADPAVTRHLAEFLQSHSSEENQPLQVTHILFNGGVFKSNSFQDRLINVLGSWNPDSSPVMLDGDHDLDYAVARGAAYYGLSKHQGGMRIRGGTAQAYYVGIETAGLAIPGAPRPLNLLNVVPIGMEEGTETNVPSQEVGLVVGEKAHFRFFASPSRNEDKPGTLLASWNESEVVETDSLEMVLDTDESIEEAYVPVTFQSKITELGMFELWCVSPKTGGRWKLEFNIRDDD
ncbi:MAG: molecular chaperone DnaK [Blastopirellula sp.]|nr:MAG: molecular chaperone DnaK [Blastopirellula sp.]